MLVLALILWVGGTTRTEGTYIPPNLKIGRAQITFEEKLNTRHWLGGLIKGKQPDLQVALGKHLQEGGQGCAVHDPYQTFLG